MTSDDKILKILDALSLNVATILQEQQAQRTDIRSLQRDVSYLKIDIETGKSELVTKMEKIEEKIEDKIEAVRAELKADIETAKIELKSEVSKTLKAHSQRLTNLEEHVGIADPTKH